jgi:hypothetical protein
LIIDFVQALAHYKNEHKQAMDDENNEITQKPGKDIKAVGGIFDLTGRVH